MRAIVRDMTRGRPALPPEMRKPRSSGPGGKPRRPTPDEIARVQALLARLYPPGTWPDGPPRGGPAELAKRVGAAAQTVRLVLTGKRAVSEATIAAWEAAVLVS